MVSLLGTIHSWIQDFQMSWGWGTSVYEKHYFLLWYSVFERSETETSIICEKF